MNAFFSRWACFLLLGVSLPAQAQKSDVWVPGSAGGASSQPVDDPLSQDELKGIFRFVADEQQVTVGGGRPTPLRESPGSVWVLDEAAIRESAALSVYDVIRQLPGTITRELNLSHTETFLRYYGTFPDNQTLVLIDGRPVQNDAIGNYDRQLINLRDVERIEQVLGPASTLYGANAFSGVLSITRAKPRLAGFSTTLEAKGGGATGMPNVNGSQLQLKGLAQGYGRFEYGWGSGGVLVAAGGEYFPGFGYLTDSGRILQVDGRRASGRIDVIQNVKRWELRLQLEGTYKDSVYEQIDGADTRQNDYSINLGVTRRKLVGRDDTLTINFWARQYQLALAIAIAGLQPTQLDLLSRSMELRSQYVMPTFYGNSVTIGAQIRFANNQLQGLAKDGAYQLLAGLYVEDTYRPIKQLVLTAGLRFDTRESLTQQPFRYAAFSPRLSAVWLINDNHSLRAEYSSAFRTPTAVERGANFVTPDGINFVTGNPNLKNEYVHSWSIGYLGRIGWFSPRIELHLTRTLNNIAPHIESLDSDVDSFEGQPLSVPPEGGRFKLPFYITNLEGFWIPGAAAQFEFNPSPHWSAKLMYTLAPVENQHTVGQSQSIHFWRVTISQQLYWVDQWAEDSTRFYDIASRFILNLKASVAIDSAKHWVVGIAGANLIDARFFYRKPRAESVGLFADTSTGERLGPRFWATLEYNFATK